MNDWHKIHITDKTGKEFFKATTSPMSTMPEIRNMKRHVANARKNPSAYNFLDANTAVIMLDGIVYSEAVEIDADALLAELGL